jgi:hypothetical protein
MTNPTFTPKPVGSPDTQRESKLTELYQEICINATGLKAELEIMFSTDEAQVTNEFVLELVKSDPEKKIRQLWVKHNKISIPGIDIDKLIASDLFSIPEHDAVIASIKELKDLFLKSKALRFYFPLEKLFDTDEGYYNLNDEFRNLVHESGIVYTQNQQQNELLEAVEQFKDSINTLCNLKFMQPSSATQRTQLLLFSALKSKYGATENPYELNPNMFNLDSISKLVGLV